MSQAAAAAAPEEKQQQRQDAAAPAPAAAPVKVTPEQLGIVQGCVCLRGDWCEPLPCLPSTHTLTHNAMLHTTPPTL
jgi:hypothetical protein